MDMRKQLEIDDIKKFSFEVLCEIRRICEEHEISYSLTGGTLIGAVRHKGFIPWDDDIDIMMPRPDYDRFISVVKASTYKNLRLLSAEINGDAYPYPFAKACHPDTELYEKDMQQGGVTLGVYVDIFPVDGIGMTYRSAKIRCMLFQIFHGLKVTSNWESYRRSNLRKWYYEPFRFVCYLISKMIPRRWLDHWIDRFMRRKEFQKSVYAGRLVGDFGSREIALRKLFEEKTMLEFEGERFSAVADYDTFLTNLYGDYMKLPPKEKQVSHHHYEAYLKQEQGL